MPQRCCVCRVEKTHQATSEGIRFFSIPSIKSALYGEWIRAIKIEGNNLHFKPKRTSIICSRHFTSYSFFVRRDAKVCLKDSAKPTIFDLSSIKPILVESEKIPTNVAQLETNDSNIKDDDVSNSPSPTYLLPAVSEYNSDYEENVEEPPDLDIYSDSQGIDDDTSNLLADPNTTSVDHIESVANILGQDAYLSPGTVEEEMMNQERPEPGGTVELDIIDGQPIISFPSVEEMEEYSAHHRSSSLFGSIAKINESSGSRSCHGKCKLGSGQPTPSLSPFPTPYQMLNGTSAPVFYDDSYPSTTPSPSIDMDNEEKGVSITIAEPSPSATDEEESPSLTPASEMMDSDGYLTPQFAEFSVSSVNVYQRGRCRVRSAKKAEEESPPPLRVRKKKAVSVAAQSKTVQPPSQEAVNLVKTGVDSREEVPVLEEYLEVYDVPGKANVSAGSCGKLFCQMGCVCPSLEEATSRKTSTEHCSRPDCMLQCVCGYLPGKPSSQRTISSLLKGNESFYSKTNWSSRRSKRERKIPERFSEFHLNKDSMHSLEENSVEYAKQENVNKRLASPFKPSKKVAIQLQQKQQVLKTKPDTLRIKNGAEEIKLLRWDGFVSMKKIYVAPDQEVYCIEHSNCTCPCIAENRRIIRILNKFIPPNVQITESNEKMDSVVSPPNKNVARKHAHPTADLKSASPINGSDSPEVGAPSPTPVILSAPSTSSVPSKPPDQVPLNKPEGNGMSKIRKLLQDDRFQLLKLMNEEKMRAFDDEIDLTIRSGQTAQLVAWMRFHSVYHSGKMHIRYFSRRSGSVILVMKPTEVVAPDITCDIQDMKDKPNTPEIVNELLDSCISSEETSRYAFLLCDGVKWELVGCLSVKASTVLPTPVPPQPKPAETTQKSLPSSSGPKKKPKNVVTKALPEVILEEHPLSEEYQAEPSIPKAIPEKTPAPAVPSASKYEDNSTEARLTAIEFKRKKPEERLNRINSNLYSAPVNVSFPARSMKPKTKKHSSTAKDPLLSSSPAVKEPLPTSNTCAPSQSTDCSFDQCIPPDEISKHSELCQSNGSDSFLPDTYLNRSDSYLNGGHSNGQSSSRYPAAEKLIMFSRQVMNNQDVGIKKSSRNSMSAPEPRPLAPPTVLFSSPASLPKRPDGQPVILTSIGVGSVPPTITSTGPNRPSYIPPLQRMSNTASALGLISPPTVVSNQRSTLADRIRLQRLEKTNKRVIPSVVVKNVSAVGPNSIAPSMPITAFTASTPIAPALKIISTHNASAASTAAVTLILGNQVEGCSSYPIHKPSTTVTPQKLQTTINTSINSEQAEFVTVSPVPSRNKTQKTVDTSKKNEEEINNSFFPKVLSTHVGPVRLVKSTEEGRTVSIRLKISFAALTGEHRDLSPAPSTMLLPLYNTNDEWCMVACPAVPEAGLQIPGVNILIPRDAVVQAATTAVERKARVSYPLHFHGKASSPIFKKGFGIYGTSQLPNHVFLGPFRTEHLDSFATIPTCMFRISSKTEATAAPVIVSGTSTKESSASQSTHEKPIEERPVDESSKIVPTIDKEDDVVKPKPVSDLPVPESPESRPPLEDNSNAPSDDISDQNVQLPVTSLDDPADLNQPVPKIQEKGLPESAGEDNVSNRSTESQQDSGVDDKSSCESSLKSAPAEEESDVEIVGECKKYPREPLFPKKLALPNLPKDFGTHKFTKPQRNFVARTPGLPTTTITIFEDNLVLVKHPLKPEKSVSFSGIDAAKSWLQSLTVLNKDKGARSMERKRSAPVDESSSTSARHAPERKRRSHDCDGEPIYYQKCLERSDVPDQSCSASSPKRVRRLTEKARILAAQSSRRFQVSPEPERSTSARGPHSKLVQSRLPKARSELLQTPNQHSSFKKTNRNRQLNIIQEQERRVLLAKLFRDLDSLLVPNSGVHAKISVLKNATSTIKSLEKQNKVLRGQGEKLRTHRVALLKKRRKILNELPNEVRQIFKCFMDMVPVPARHATLEEARS